ncbi:MAG: tRNA uracil 4-sulfurtransferase ThiI [Methanobrevibacter boviskoreani]|jgi:thiamine biosynthesis protein ThiI|uniref:tRNA uracil 4-sulfurtransferase ThiI n=1 Tax=Methanobrevibacter boviskoreani TaxID=1348249 RepID=UPI0023F48C45|nr:tRNA uracil 4-sulfurtransferase ThiI [Methanobrevibacter boviskoreani]MDD6256308.1 tRNA 4-thiouridine(8) synthase ThiI [Methanobrevibacter boviskoreani]
MDYDLILIRYGELALKSTKIRLRFERKLVKNISASIDGNIKRDQGRIFLEPKNFEDALEKLDKIFGIVSYSPVVRTKTTKEDVTKTLTEYTKHLISEGLLKEGMTFAIRCRRVGNHDFTSQEAGAFCGSVVIDTIPLKVNLSDPDFEIFVEIRDNDTYIYHEKIDGPGGLPLGTQGKVVVLMSSGIDSPVAAYLMMKRGCAVTALNFDNSPYTTSDARNNFNDLVDQLQTYASGVPIQKRVAPYGEYLKTCKNKGPEKMTCVLCKSGMYKTAEKLAKEIGALAIVDGSSVGQVASQTLQNILSSRYGVDMPILSPLIGMDKLETTRIADKIGTFEISKRDDGGCKAVPKYPETQADLNRVIKAQEDISQEEELEKVFKNIEKED